MSGGARVTTLARAVFGLLLVATFGAFFVTQRLKHSPTVVQMIKLTPAFSPTGHGGLHRERISFRIKRADEVTVTVVNAAGADVATLARARYLPAYAQQSLRWDGVTDAGQLAPNGLYRVRFALREQRRTVEAPRSFRLRSTAPRPTVTVSAAGSPGPGPLILPLTAHGPITIRLSLGGGIRPQLEVYRTDVNPAVAVVALPVPVGALSVQWDGTAHGRPLVAGTYAVTVTDTDPAGVVGSSPTTLPPRALEGATIPGHAGITVRYVAIAAPLAPVHAGSPVSLTVDTRGRPYTYTLTDSVSSRPLVSGRGSGSLLRLRPPNDATGVYTVSVIADGHSSSVPLAVQAPVTHRVLVVMPVLTWLGQDPVDDGGDGLPDTLDAGRPVALRRFFTAIPEGFTAQVAPVLAFLDRRGLRYDLTTDLALVGSGSAILAQHPGVLLAGDERWLPLDVQAALRKYVSGGGSVGSLGTDALRRTVGLTATSITEPSPPATSDVFGARIGPLATGPTSLVTPMDRLGLFAGQATGFTAVRDYEPTISTGSGSLLSSLSTPGEQPVVVAETYGRGLVIRTAQAEFARLLKGEQNYSALMVRIWQLLSR